MPDDSVDAPKKPYSLWSDKREITRRFTLGVREVLRDHALAGRSVAVWRDGKAVLIPPEEILQIPAAYADIDDSPEIVP